MLGRFTNRSGARLNRALEWLPAVLALTATLLMWTTMLLRVGVPWELEWNEGHAAEQAIRFAGGLPLYPAASEGWVPYMYAPLYHITLGWAFTLTESNALAWGRFISLLALAAAQLSLAQLVLAWTQRASAAVFAGCFLGLGFKVCGFSFDLARVDSLALGLACLGMALALRPRSGNLAIIAGILLLVLAAFTKQPYALLAAGCGGLVALRRPAGGLIACALALLLAVNLAYFFSAGGNGEFLKYVVWNAVRHLSRPDVYYPGGLWPMAFQERIPAGGSWIAAYWKAWMELGPAALWRELGRHLWLPGLLLVGWAGLSLRRRRWWLVTMALLPVALAIWTGVNAYAKYGGFVNNFQPIVAFGGMALALAFEALRRRWAGSRRTVALACVSALLVLQAFQPWGVARLTDEVAWRLSAQEKETRLSRGMSDWGLYRARLALNPTGAGEAPVVDGAIRRRLLIARLLEPGWFWLPGTQQPHEESRKYHWRMMTWLTDRQAAGEPVWVLHHQFYGLATGHPLTYNVDMIRCAEWAGDPVPSQLEKVVLSGRYTWLVSGWRELKWEWLPAGMADRIALNYEFAGVIPGLERLEETSAMQPVTGAPTRPLYVWRLKKAAE